MRRRFTIKTAKVDCYIKSKLLKMSLRFKKNLNFSTRFTTQIVTYKLHNKGKTYSKSMPYIQPINYSSKKTNKVKNEKNCNGIKLFHCEKAKVYSYWMKWQVIGARGTKSCETGMENLYTFSEMLSVEEYSFIILALLQKYCNTFFP